MKLLIMWAKISIKDLKHILESKDESAKVTISSKVLQSIIDAPKAQANANIWDEIKVYMKNHRGSGVN